MSEVLQGVAETDLHKSIQFLLNEIRSCRRKAVVRWISRPLKNAIDIQFASKVLSAEIKTLGRLSYIVTKVDGVGVQITQTKIDLSSKADEVDKVVKALEYLSKRLGVELSKPIPVVATIIIKLPFKVNLNTLAFYERGENQVTRVKIEKESYTLLVYPSTLNIYAKLDGALDKIETIVVDALPTICTHIEKSK